MNIKYRIVIVGAGGTGGNLITGLGRFLSFFEKGGKDYCLSIIDGDTVEGRNAIRQPFFEGDIQQNKALTMMEGLLECLNLPKKKVCAFPHYIDSVEQLRSYVYAGSSSCYNGQEVVILVGAVDNNRARQVFHEFFKTCDNIVYIDSGNEFEYGEVCVGARFHGIEVYPPRAYYFPDVLKDKGKSASEISCGEMNQASPQHYVTNLFASLICLNVITQFMENNRLDGGIIHFNKDNYFLRHDNVRDMGWMHEPSAVYEEDEEEMESEEGDENEED